MESPLPLVWLSEMAKRPNARGLHSAVHGPGSPWATPGHGWAWKLNLSRPW